MKKFLNSHFAATVIILVATAFISFWGFTDTRPDIDPDFFQRNHILIAIISFTIFIAIGVMTIKNLFRRD